MEHWWNILSLLGVAAGGAIAVIWSLINGFKTTTDKAHTELQKAQSDADKARSDLAEVLQMEAAAWKQRYESEHAEYVAYREEMHKKAEGANLDYINLSRKCAELESKTDLTPVLQFQKEQTEINNRVLTGLQAITEKLSL